MQDRLSAYTGFVKLEHTVFSLPLIFAGTLLHTHGWPSAGLTLLILLAAVGGRVMALGINRIVDAELDARNPRTQRRELPRGALQRAEAWGVIVFGGVLYLVSAAAIAPVCLWLSPVPVALFVAYPHLKRVTALAHVGLGITWSMAPLGGWLAASKSLVGLAEVGWLWCFAVLWVTGFDIIYATMDETFDRQAGLHSLPVRLGSRRALGVARVLHAAAFAVLALLWNSQLYSPVALRWLVGIGALFVWQHLIAERNPAFAFFHLNAVLGFCVLGLVLTGMR